MSDTPNNSSGSIERKPRAAVWVLRVVIALQCAGVVGRYLVSEFESESHIFSYLFFEAGVAENTAQMIDDVGAFGCLAAGVILIVGGIVPALCGRCSPGKRSRWCIALRWIEYISLAFVSCWFLADGLAYMARGEDYGHLILGEIAVRYGAPLGLICLLSTKQIFADKRYIVADWLLVLTSTATFFVHGYKAIQLYGPFTDLVLLTDLKLLKFELEQRTAETMLLVIGWVDVGLAVALVAARWRSIAVYMIVWGLITAASRVTAFGGNAWPETIVRSANWGVPLALLMLWAVRRDSTRANRST